MLALRNFQGLEFGTEHYESDGLWGERVPAPGYPVAHAPRLSLCLCLWGWQEILSQTNAILGNAEHTMDSQDDDFLMGVSL